MSASLSTYSREQLSEILRIVKLYKNSLAQIGRRAVIQDPKVHADAELRVEYPTGTDMKMLESFVSQALTKYFDTPTPKSINWIANPSLVGGVRIFVGDDMIDLSFQRFATLLKNS